MKKMTNLWTKNVDIFLLFLILAVSIFFQTEEDGTGIIESKTGPQPTFSNATGFLKNTLSAYVCNNDDKSQETHCTCNGNIKFK